MESEIELAITFNEKEYEKVLNILQYFPYHLKNARRFALSSVSFMAIQILKSFIQKGGDGVHRQIHNLPANFTKNTSDQWYKRKQIFAYGSLGKFARYIINPNANFVTFGFGRFSGEEVRDSQVSFDSKFEKYIKQMQQRYTVPISRKTRDKLLLTRNYSSKLQIGKNFFPLKRNTQTFFHEARSLAPAIVLMEQIINTNFSNNLERGLDANIKGIKIKRDR